MGTKTLTLQVKEINKKNNKNNGDRDYNIYKNNNKQWNNK